MSVVVIGDAVVNPWAMTAVVSVVFCISAAPLTDHSLQHNARTACNACCAEASAPCS